MAKWIKLAKEAGLSFVTFPTIWAKYYDEGVRRIVGDEGEAILAYDSGKETVKEIARFLKKAWKLNGKKFLTAAQEFFAEMGMGEVSMVYPKIGLRKDKFIFRISNSYIARARFASKRSEKPVCHLFRGYAAGIIEELTGWKMDAEETKCLAMGDSYCEFVVTRVVSTS